MSKSKSIYACQQCGAVSPKWMGRCNDCGEWNTYIEERVKSNTKGVQNITSSASVPVALPDVSFNDDNKHIPSGIMELDRVLGGGLVSGSVVLIGGDPGIGKSTIVLQAFSSFSTKFDKLLYVSGEESASQIKMRASRLGIDDDNLYLLTENCLETLLGQIDKMRPKVVAIDSIQTLYSENIASAPGTVSQVRESCAQLIQFAKANNISLMLIGHVTKEGSIAGPKVMEHMVDTVLYFEGERGHSFRILRSIKNRFGATSEIGVFEMTGKGLKEVLNPSGLFLSERAEGASGTIVVSSLEGSRPLLIELQALVSASSLANPRRTCIGMDTGRLALLIAVLEKIVGLELQTNDVFLNLAGGIKVVEPAVDLGAVTSIFSSLHSVPACSDTVVIGEVGLGGEVRAVMGCEVRLKEIEKMGFKRCIIPKTNMKNIGKTGLNVVGVTSVDGCLKELF